MKGWIHALVQRELKARCFNAWMKICAHLSDSEKIRLLLFIDKNNPRNMFCMKVGCFEQRRVIPGETSRKDRFMRRVFAMETEEKSTQKKETTACAMDEKDSKGHTNTCCCYVMNPDGTYEDPCFYPAGSCC